MNYKIQQILAQTLSKKSEWLSEKDPFSSAFGYAIKELHKEKLLTTSGEFSLSHLTHKSKKIAA